MPGEEEVEEEAGAGDGEDGEPGPAGDEEGVFGDHG